MSSFVKKDANHNQVHGDADHSSTYVKTSDANWVDLTDGGPTTLHSHAGGAISIPEYQTDPASPVAGDTWVLAPRHSAGLAMGALAMTYATNDGFYYDLSFRTVFGETKRVRLG